jgi:CheY-like chemotaxis protein
VAHDFNNLLAGVMGNAELALASLPPGDPSRESLQAVILAAKRAAALCRDMLAYAGKGKWRVEPLDVSGVVRGVAHVLSVSIARTHRLEYSLVGGLPAVEGDAAQMQQAVLNLVRNATEAIGAEEGIIRVATATRVCDGEYLAGTCFAEKPPPGRYVSIAVTDTGCGMDADTRARIFEPFFSTSTHRRGLGLASVRGIVQGHGGTLRIDSAPGRGSTFTVLLPASDKPVGAPADATTAPASETAAEEVFSAWKPAGAVLVVEDDATIARFVEQALTSVGCKVICAADGQAGVDAYRAHAGAIAVVLLDLTLPRLNGEEVLREIRASKPDARVVLSSGDTPDRVAQLGANAFVRKPYELASLMRTVRKLVETG